MNHKLALTGSLLMALAVPAAVLATSPSPTALPPDRASGSPAAVTSPAELLWTATGDGDGMNFPASIVLDPQGRLWVADAGNSRFAIFTPDGTFVEYWGSKGKGDGQFNLTYASGNPNGSIAFEPDGSFFVLDAANRRVQHFDKDRKFLNSWGGFGTGPGQYNDAIGIAIDSQGLVHLLDDGRDVVETYDQDGTVLGSFSPGLPGPNTADSLALDAQGNAYVSACCSAGNGVRKFDPKGTLVTTIGAGSSGPGRFADSPVGMAIDSAGRLFVTDGPTGSADKVLVFDADGSYLSSFASPGSGPGQIGFAWGVALDGQGNVYVVDAGGNRLEKFRLLPPLAPSASASAAASPAALLPEGRYATAPLTQAMIRAAVTAAGYDPGPVQSTPKSTVFTLSFDSGRLRVYGSDDGGPIQLGWDGTYEVVDDHTLAAHDAISNITYDFKLNGDVLTMRMVSDSLQDPGELSAQAGIYDTAPFTRLP